MQTLQHAIQVLLESFLNQVVVTIVTDTFLICACAFSPQEVVRICKELYGAHDHNQGSPRQSVARSVYSPAI